MKRVALVVVCLTFLFASVAVAQNVGKIPDIKGAWEASAELHHQATGHMKSDGKAGRWVIDSQEGQVFSGKIEWNGKHKGNDTFSGVITNDGKGFYIAGHSDGIRIGEIDGPDAMTVYLLVPGGEKPRAGIIRLTRAK